MNKTTLAIIATLSLAASLHASLIGDALTIRRPYPNLGTDFALSVSTVVAAEESDGVSPQPHHYTINPESENILIDFHNTSGFGGVDGGVFDGLQFLGITREILSVSIVEATGIAVSGIDYGNGFINVNLSGMFSSSSYLNLQVITADSDVAAVPEPSTLMLAGLGLGALMLVARKRRSR